VLKDSAEICFSINLEDRLCTCPLAFFSGGCSRSVLVSKSLQSISFLKTRNQITLRHGSEVCCYQTELSTAILNLFRAGSYRAVLISRFFLGFTEAVYYPGILFMLSRWYMTLDFLISH